MAWSDAARAAAAAARKNGGAFNDERIPGNAAQASVAANAASRAAEGAPRGSELHQAAYIAHGKAYALHLQADHDALAEAHSDKQDYHDEMRRTGGVGPEHSSHNANR